MNASFANALLAAHEAAAGQHYAQATLYVIATPIGNLADISLRALHVLHLVDALACEDTRHTQSLMRAYGIEKTSEHCLAVHQHNEAQAAQTVIERLRQGQRIAYVSDAGTPGVSDPGARLVAAVRAAGFQVSPLPGASSITAALSVSGAVPHAEEQEGFVFAGFLPAKAQMRQAAISALAREARAIVLLEAPHRIAALAQALVELGPRGLTVGRELTKQFEEVATIDAAGFPAWLEGQPQRLKGEFVLVLHPIQLDAGSDRLASERMLSLLLEHLPLKTAVKLTAELSGESKNTLYTRALALKPT